MLCKVYGNSALLALNGTSLNLGNALLALGRRNIKQQQNDRIVDNLKSNREIQEFDHLSRLGKRIVVYVFHFEFEFEIESQMWFMYFTI